MAVKHHVFLVLLLSVACSNDPSETSSHEDPSSALLLSGFDIQGHRGCRGLLPENSIPGFIKALALGVSTLELDVVISKDSQVVVSHEPWLSPEICLDPEGNPMKAQHPHEAYNLFQMTYAEIREFDCGSKETEAFPTQRKLSTPKPLLSEVIDTVEAYLAEHGTQVFYNIETKSQPQGDKLYHPEPLEFVQLLLEVVNKKAIQERVIIQSFDPRTLQEVHRLAPDMATALLVGESQGSDVTAQFAQLGYVPPFYSPNWKLVDSSLIANLHGEKVKVIPWTVNKKEDMRALIGLGVDGIISDYPDSLIAVIQEIQQ